MQELDRRDTASTCGRANKVGERKQRRFVVNSAWKNFLPPERHSHRVGLVDWMPWSYWQHKITANNFAENSSRLLSISLEKQGFVELVPATQPQAFTWADGGGIQMALASLMVPQLPSSFEFTNVFVICLRYILLLRQRLIKSVVGRFFLLCA